MAPTDADAAFSLWGNEAERDRWRRRKEALQKAQPTFRSDGVAVAAGWLAGPPWLSKSQSGTIQIRPPLKLDQVGGGGERDFAQFEREERGIPSSDQKAVPISYYELGTRFIFGGWCDQRSRAPLPFCMFRRWRMGRMNDTKLKLWLEIADLYMQGHEAAKRMIPS